jgi:hypothetical protein
LSLEFRISAHQLTHKIYPAIEHLNDLSEAEKLDFLRDRVILCPLNSEVDSINESILEQFPGDEIICLSADRASDSTDGPDSASLPIEYLNTLNFSGMALHRTALKLGCPIILLRNLDPANGLCNGTRLMLMSISPHVLEAIILSGEHAGKRAFIPRISLSTPPNLDFPFTLHRRQFPVRLAFAMTINKAQGQSVPVVGVNLTTSVFSHGQLYVALSRATDFKSLFVVLPEQSMGTTPNIVFKEALLPAM